MSVFRLLVLLFSLSGIAHADGSKVALGGYCPVAYVKMQQAVFGDPKFASEYQGRLYYSSNADAKAMFDKDPASYADTVKYDGYCATAVSMGKKIPADPNIFSAVDGKIYFFSSAEAKAMFDKDSKSYITKGDKSWTKLAKK